ncbi:MAG TPA: hypothetical protein VLR94_10045 [Acidobacteriota bacterium]|nr:hypothetical protein [Acidobacteriota bacterium]
MKGFILFLVFAVATLVAASSFAGPKLPEACKILPAPDVEKVVGAGFKVSSFTGTASDNSSCSYLKDARNVVTLLIVPLGLGEDGFTGDTAVALKEMQKAYAGKIVTIEGAGEGAFRMNTPNNMAVHFGKSPWHVVLTVVVDGKPDSAAAEKLAKTVYPRL